MSTDRMKAPLNEKKKRALTLVAEVFCLSGGDFWTN